MAIYRLPVVKPWVRVYTSGRRSNFAGNLWWSEISTQRLRGEEAITIRVLITEDHKVVRRGLRGFLELDPAMEVVGEAE